MEYQNSPQLKAWLMKSGWHDAVAGQESFVLDDAKFAEQVRMLEKTSAEDQLNDRAAFRCLTLNATKSTKAAIVRDSTAIAVQQRQVSERARQQQEHEVRLVSELSGLRAAQEQTPKAVEATIGGRFDALKESVDARFVDLESIVHSGRAITGASFGAVGQQMAALKGDVTCLRDELTTHEASLKRLNDTVYTVAQANEAFTKSQQNSWIRFGIIGFLILAAILIFAVTGHAQQANVNPCIATATNPSYTVGQRVPCHVTLDGTTVVTLGSTSVSVTVPGTVAATQSGTWTVQPGNTANTTAWKVDGSAVTQPVSGTITVGNGAGASAVNIQDGGNTITVDGTVTATPTGTQDVNLVSTITVPVSAASLPLPSGASTEATLSTLNGKVTAVNTGAVTVSTFPDNEPFNVAQMNGVAVTMGNGAAGTGVQRVTLASDSTGQVALAAGTALAGEIAPVTTATTTNTALTSYTTSAASTNSTSVKASAGNVYGIRVINTTSTIYYLRMYNSSSAPTCSSATGFIETIPVPNGAGAGAGFVSMQPFGQSYTTGIGYCLTGGGSSTDNTNAATGVYITVLYK